MTCEPALRTREPGLLLVCYDPVELSTLLDCIVETGRGAVPGSLFPLIEGCLDGQPLSLMRIPFGDNVGLLQTVVRELLATTSPASVIGIGTAMACAPAFEVGDVVASQAAHYRGREVEFGGWLNPDLLACVPHDLTVRVGRSVTTPAFVGGLGDRDALLAGAPRADTIEMEDFHVASLVAEFGARFASLRTLTDRGDVRDHCLHLTAAAASTVRMLRRALRHRRMRAALISGENAETADLAHEIVVKRSGAPLAIPEAVALARRALAAFNLGALLGAGVRLVLTLHDAPPLEPERPATPSGQAKVLSEPGRWCLVHDPVTHATCLDIVEDVLGAGASRVIDARESFRAADVRLVARSHRTGPAYRLPRPKRFHIQGLNSLSAEPEEGLLAATTVAEFLDAKEAVGDSKEADCWVYRTADAGPASYFEPDYPVPGRVSAELPAGTYLVATGLGPAIDPAARSGTAAAMLLLGDEQGGRLLQILDDLGSGRFPLDAVFRYEGLALRLAPSVVALSRLDRRLLLTANGLNSLRYDPGLLRGVYSDEYDAFLTRYFGLGEGERTGHPTQLLMTSRGCGARCSFCCSGGLQPFTALEPEVLVQLLREVRDHHRPAPGRRVDVYILDSYFNRNAERIVRLAERLEQEGLPGQLAFHVRHSGLAGFLKHRAEDGAAPAVHHGLIAAYRRLGMAQVVMGVDAYTDGSIRALKTSFEHLIRDGERTRPAYTFEDIEAVVVALDQAGLPTRCFLLVYNPFAGDVDRIGTFYNLLRLALKAPSFSVDVTSSDRVNELKPFPGAPLTRLAEQIPGLVRGGRFDYATALGRVEDLMDLPIFGGRRESPAAMAGFVRAAQASRGRLARHIQERLLACAEGPAGPTAEIVAAARRLVAEEERGRPLYESRLAELSHLAGGERELVGLVGELAQLAGPADDDGPSGHERFFEALRGWRPHGRPSSELACPGPAEPSPRIEAKRRS